LDARWRLNSWLCRLLISKFLETYGKTIMLKRLLVVAAAIVMTGCAVIPEYKFSKAGASEADFHRDKTQCDDEAFSAGNVVRLKYIEVRNACLVKKGWSQVTAK
jgi:hypothetical protein